MPKSTLLGARSKGPVAWPIRPKIKKCTHCWIRDTTILTILAGLVDRQDPHKSGGRRCRGSRMPGKLNSTACRHSRTSTVRGKVCARLFGQSKWRARKDLPSCQKKRGALFRLQTLINVRGAFPQSCTGLQRKRGSGHHSWNMSASSISSGILPA